MDEADSQIPELPAQLHLVVFPIQEQDAAQMWAESPADTNLHTGMATYKHNP